MTSGYQLRVMSFMDHMRRWLIGDEPISSHHGTSIYSQWSSYETAEPGVRSNSICQQFNGQLVDNPSDQVAGIETVWHVFQRGLALSPNDHCLGWREEAFYKWWSYKDVANRVEKLAQALAAMGVRRQAHIGIYAGPKPNWIVTALACTSRSLVVVPLYDTLGADSCSYIINQVEMSLLFVDTPAAARRVIANAKTTPSLRQIVIFTEPGKDVEELAKENGITLVTLDQFVSDGQSANTDIVSSPYDLPAKYETFVIIYTSGTTGDPKGVVHTHRSFIANLSGIDSFYWINWGHGLAFKKDDVALQYLPLAHAYGLMVSMWFLYRGASIGFFGGNVLKLMEDAQLLRPTFMPMVPRLMNRVYSKVLSELEKSKVKSALFWTAYRRKREALKNGVITRSSIWDKLVFNKIQNLLGGRVWFMSAGSAPVSAEVLEFWRVVFGCLILEGYGQTECVAAATTAMGPVGGNVGHPLPCNLLKLADAPECGYLVRDGRGEVCVKGPNVMVGYYKRPDLTAEALDDDGWLHTGDIGEFLPDGSLKIVDRKKNLFKLAQGEYITPEKIESVYLLCPKVLQVFVDGNSLEYYTVAVVVPDPALSSEYAAEHRIDQKDLATNKDFVKLIFDAMIAVGKANKLNSLEQVKSICLAIEPFTIDNGLLTPTLKNKRTELRKFFKSKIDAAYKAGPFGDAVKQPTHP